MGVANTLNTNPLHIGANYTGIGSFFEGYIDEFAAWNRVLGDGTNGTPNEVLELYRRGANRIKFQVRTCADPGCATPSPGPSWIGPDNTAQTYFSELNNLSQTGAVQAGAPDLLFNQENFPGLTIESNRYFQYRAVFETDDAQSLCNYGAGPVSCSPELQSVTVNPSP
jgi:hypothetical protein